MSDIYSVQQKCVNIVSYLTFVVFYGQSTGFKCLVEVCMPNIMICVYLKPMNNKKCCKLFLT